MNQQDRELMQQALEALEYAADHIGCPDDDDAIGVARKALRERLAQPEQEPVAWLTNNNVIVDGLWETRQTISLYDDGGIPLYTAPHRREWVGLTKEEAKEISLANRPYVVDMIAALEARLKEKNT